MSSANLLRCDDCGESVRQRTFFPRSVCRVRGPVSGHAAPVRQNRSWSGTFVARCRQRCSSRAPAFAQPSLAEVWGYVDADGTAHVATEKLDERYQLFFKGRTNRDAGSQVCERRPRGAARDEHLQADGGSPEHRSLPDTDRQECARAGNRRGAGESGDRRRIGVRARDRVDEGRPRPDAGDAGHGRALWRDRRQEAHARAKAARSRHQSADRHHLSARPAQALRQRRSAGARGLQRGRAGGRALRQPHSTLSGNAGIREARPAVLRAVPTLEPAGEARENPRACRGTRRDAPHRRLPRARWRSC